MLDSEPRSDARQSVNFSREIGMALIRCTFKLNREPMSEFVISRNKFPAFSGLGVHVNQPRSECLVGVGPIPLGEYFIIDRESGGLRDKLRNLIPRLSRKDWFSLYADDHSIDDEKFCDELTRGNFRLHPKGDAGISQGCVVINNYLDFQKISGLLRVGSPTPIPNSRFLAWGKLKVEK